MQEDTIAAIGTPQGIGGIGIIRLSGPGAFDIALEQFRTPTGKRLSGFDTHRIYYGKVVEQEDVLDTVILLPMKGPKSYTREDVIEFQCHGGLIPVKKILEVLLLGGARLAEPGEFTMRAYLNGRLDLIQAESVIDLIRAKTDKSMNLALHQLNGDLSSIIKAAKESYIKIGSTLETRIEFVEEDIEIEDNAPLIETVADIQKEISRLIESFRAGKFFTEGVLLVIAGTPNVGKSSLLNAFLNEERSIVTDIPGTTRDFIEETMSIEGIPFRITDTAGIADTGDIVEQEGIRRSECKISQADITIFLLDGMLDISEKECEIAKKLDAKRSIIVINKSDMPQKFTIESLKILNIDCPSVHISALKKRGIEELKSAIVKKLGIGENLEKERILVSSERQVIALKEAFCAGERILSALRGNISEELIMVDVWSFIHALDSITGETYVEEILNDIFSRFCIGK